MTLTTTTEDESATVESIAQDIREYMRGAPDITATGSTMHWYWVRYKNGEWRGLRTGGKHRLGDYLHGRTFTDEEFLEWQLNNPVNLLPSDEASHGREDESIWAKADTQGVFTDKDRCFWCGHDEDNVALTEEQAVEHGEILLCGECRPTWEKQDEIV